MSEIEINTILKIIQNIVLLIYIPFQIYYIYSIIKKDD